MRRRRSIFRADPNGSPDINTTPLIDVMLVMLVMLVITIPPPTHKVDVTPVSYTHLDVYKRQAIVRPTSPVVVFRHRGFRRLRLAEFLPAIRR